MIEFIAFGSKSSGGPYVLWTWIFSTAGVRKLDKRGVFNIQHRDSLNADEEEKDGIVLNDDNETSRVEQKNTLANNNKKYKVLNDISVDIC